MYLSDVKTNVVIVHYGDKNLLIDCLNSLSNLINLNTLIVSNNNPIPLKPELPKDLQKIQIVENKKNLGYAGGINSGIRYALHLNPDYILIITEDTTYDRNFFKEIIIYAQQNQDDVVGPTVIDQKTNKVWYQGGEIDPYRYTAGHKKGKTDYVPGCCVLVKTEVFKTIGLLDDRYFVYYEDVDFDLRAKQAGYKIGVCKKAIVYHDTYHNPATYKNMVYYLARNHWLFLFNFAPLSIKVRELIRLSKTIFEHIYKQEYDALAGILDAFRSKYGKRT